MGRFASHEQSIVQTVAQVFEIRGHDYTHTGVVYILSDLYSRSPRNAVICLLLGAFIV